MAEICTAKDGPEEISSMDRFNQLMSGTQCVFICFYMDGCPHCENYAPVHEMIAKTLHSSFAKTGGNCTQVVVARMNGPQFVDQLVSATGRPESEWGFPTLLMKDAAGQKHFSSGASETEELLRKMASLFGDSKIEPQSCSLKQVVPHWSAADDANTEGKSVLLYRGGDVWTARDPTKISSATSKAQLNSTLCRWLQSRPDVAKHLVALDLDSTASVPPALAEAWSKSGSKTLQLPAVVHLDGSAPISGQAVFKALKVQ